MNMDQTTRLVRRWLRQSAATPPDASRSARQVIARLPHVRQRSRWWPLPVLERGTRSSTVTDTNEYEPSLFLADNGHFPIVIGRTQIMFSPVKAIVAGALVFALGGMFLISQPLGQQGGAPGAATEVVGESTAVTARTDCTLTTSGTWQRASAPYSLTGHVLTCTENASDPRVTGTSTVVLNIEGWNGGLLQGNAADSVSWNEYTLEGPDGSWSGYGYGFYDSEQTAHVVNIAVGSGAYEGLTYTQSLTVPNGTPNGVSVGLIQTGSPPPGFPVEPFLLPESE